MRQKVSFFFFFFLDKGEGVDHQKDGLSDARGAEVYRRAIPDGRVLVTRTSHELLLPKLVAGEFAPALDKVADGGGPESGHESRRSFFRDDETPSGEEAVARKSGIYLDACLHDIDRCQVPDVRIIESGQESALTGHSAMR